MHISSKLAKALLLHVLLIGGGSAVSQEAQVPLQSGSVSQASISRSPSQEPFFVSTNWNVGFTLGVGVGLSENHDLAIATLHLGRQLDADQTPPSRFLHHLELGLELWGAQQIDPDAAYIFGLNPLLRYRLLPDSRWTPFVDLGIGFSATDIGETDGTAFNLDLHAGLGLQWRWKENIGLIFQARYLYLWDANVCFSDDAPSFGSISLSGGLTWFF